MDLGRTGFVMSGLALAGVLLLYVKVDRLTDLVRADRRLPPAAPALTIPDAWSSPPSMPPPLAQQLAQQLANASGGAVALARDETMTAVLSTGSVVYEYAQLDLKTSVSSVDELAQQLGLTESQKAQAHDVVAWTKRWMEDVMTLPGPGGVSPRASLDPEKRAVEQLAAEGGTFTIGSGANYRAWKIPGREVTYGEELDRLAKEGREQLGRLLDFEQLRKLRNVATEGLFGSGDVPGTISLSFQALGTVQSGG